VHLLYKGPSGNSTICACWLSSQVKKPGPACNLAGHEEKMSCEDAWRAVYHKKTAGQQLCKNVLPSDGCGLQELKLNLKKLKYLYTLHP